jgi:hypothetical protein
MLLILLDRAFIYRCIKSSLYILHAYNFGNDRDLEYAEVAEKYKEDVLIVGVLKAFTNFLLSHSCLRQAPGYNPYFSTLTMFNLFVH